MKTTPYWTNSCFYCEVEISEDEVTIDHVIPKSKGGADNDNIVPTCEMCNQMKADLSLHDFAIKLKRKYRNKQVLHRTRLKNAYNRVLLILIGEIDIPSKLKAQDHICKKVEEVIVVVKERKIRIITEEDIIPIDNFHLPLEE